jgi:hypothetical protein
VAVVQISRIQVRRGQANQGSGIPQLAGGEFGWAVDTQELFIGNGAVSEGAPYVGNTKVLTEHDNFFDLAETYQYRPGSIDTAPGGVQILRSLQDRLDDRLSVRSFGCAGNGTDVTERLQKALFELYLRQDTETNPQSRVVLHVEAGEYVISDTIYLPPYTNIAGAGIDKTVFKKTGAFNMFETVSGESLYTGDVDTAIMVAEPLLTASDQSRGVFISGCTIQTTVNDGTLLKLNSCADGHFERIKFAGPKTTGAATDAGVYMQSKTDLVGTRNNKFVDCDFTGLGYGVESDHYIVNNVFENCTFNRLVQGIKVGVNQAVGQTGATDNTIRSCTFEDINEHAIYFADGTRNASIQNRFGNSVGNDGGDDSLAAYGIIKYAKEGNISVDDDFARTYNLSINQVYIVNDPYIPEIEGPVFAEFPYTQSVEVGQTNSELLLFRLPADVTRSFDIEYTYATDVEGRIFSRAGTMRVNVNRENNSVSVNDDYDVSGSESLAESLEFTGQLINYSGNWTCKVNYVNTLDSGNLRFKVKNKS